jgi:hypothetical protein
MANKTGIANGALVKLGQDLINDIADTSSKAARLCNERIDNARQVVLESVLFNGATTRVTLAADLDVPAYDYSNQFSLPSDCLRLVTVEPTNGSTKYDIEEDKILFDGTSLEIIYVKDQTDYNKLSPLVNETISAYLAYDLAYIITNDDSVVQQMERLFEKTKRKATTANNRQRKKESFYADGFITARLVGGYPSQYPQPTT